MQVRLGTLPPITTPVQFSSETARETLAKNQQVSQAPKGRATTVDESDPQRMTSRKRQYAEQLQLLDDQMRARHEAINKAFLEDASSLKGEYDIERKYLEATPMEADQRDEKVRRLNKEYDLRLHRLRQSYNPRYALLEQEMIIAFSKVKAAYLDVQE